MAPATALMWHEKDAKKTLESNTKGSQQTYTLTTESGPMETYQELNEQERESCFGKLSRLRETFDGYHRRGVMLRYDADGIVVVEV